VTGTLTTSVRAAMEDAARTAILPRYQALAAGEIEDKGGNDPVTVADRESEAMLAQSLARIVPEATVVGEEATHADPSLLHKLGSGLAWIIDPLDGTRNFAVGKPPFGIIVALSDGGVPVAGWIYDVLSGRFCHVEQGGGAWIDGQRLSARATGQTPPVAAISLVFSDEAQRAAIKQHIAPHYSLVDIPYCAAEQYPRIALGVNDVSIFQRTLPWDHAAGALWLNEAGGMVARPDGSAYRVDEPGRTGLIGASSPALFDALAERLAKLS